MKKLTVIGATGKLAVPIINQLLKKGVEVTAIVRDLTRAHNLLPDTVQFVHADLRDIKSLTVALSGVEYLYLNLSSDDPSAEFIPEYHGIANIVKALDKSTIKQIIQISGLAAVHSDFHTSAKTFFTNDIRLKGFQLIKDSNIPHTRMHASWFLDAIPWFFKDNKVTIYGDHRYPLFWTNTVDFADQLEAAIGNERAYNADFILQGNEGLTMMDAARIFADSVKSNVEIAQLPISKELGKFGDLMSYFEEFEEQLVAQHTWDVLGTPKLNAATYFAECLD